MATREFKSSVFPAASGSPSLKTTVPLAVATVLGLEPKDELSWEVDPDTRRVVVSKVPPGDVSGSKRSKRA